MQSFVSKEYVREQFAWRHFYWSLTDQGIEYLREYLNIPSEVVPATLRKTQRTGSRPSQRDSDRPRAPGGGYDRSELLFLVFFLRENLLLHRPLFFFDFRPFIFNILPGGVCRPTNQQGEETETDTADQEDTATGTRLAHQENTDQSSEEEEEALDVVVVLAGAVESFLLHSRRLSRILQNSFLIMIWDVLVNVYSRANNSCSVCMAFSSS